MALDVTRGDAMIPAEVLVADAAGKFAPVAGDLARLAHREPSDARAVAFRTGEGPVARAIEPALRDESCANDAAADQLPLRALDEKLALSELHRVHDGANVMPALLLGSATHVLGIVRPVGWLDTRGLHLGQDVLIDAIRQGLLRVGLRGRQGDACRQREYQAQCRHCET